eukprot:SAG22_NODE_101_length_20519_cov_15.588002_12_plen_107_part_00
MASFVRYRRPSQRRRVAAVATSRGTLAALHGHGCDFRRRSGSACLRGWGAESLITVICVVLLLLPFLSLLPLLLLLPSRAAMTPFLVRSHACTSRRRRRRRRAASR